MARKHVKVWQAAYRSISVVAAAYNHHASMTSTARTRRARAMAWRRRHNREAATSSENEQYGAAGAGYQ